MMTCAQYRRASGADPEHADEEMATHVAGCHACALYADQIRVFERRLLAAMNIDAVANPVGDPAGDRVGPAPMTWSAAARASMSRRARPWRRGFAIAASVLLATVAAGGLWLAAPGRSLAADVVTHMADEPDAWERTDAAVPSPRLSEVMDASHVRLKANVGLVSYANSCQFRGHRVPHLVVQTPTGPVTVMVLARETVRQGVHFDEQGYRGMIVRVPDHGSIAVLEKEGSSPDARTLESVAAQVAGALEWTQGGPSI